MAKKANIIELNGKRYDAITGELLAQPAVAAKPATHAVRSVDGFVRQPQHPAAAHHAAKPAATVHKTVQPVVKRSAHAVQAAPVATQPVVRSINGIQRAPSRHAAAHRPQHATTLVRSAVQHPGPSLKRRTKAVTRTDVLAKTPSIAIAPKYSFHTVDERRLRHAKQIAKSKLISRFGTVTTVPAAHRVVAAPAPAVPPHQPAQQPAAPVSEQPQRSLDVFERALAHANSHSQPAPAVAKKHHRAWRRAINITAGGLAVLVIGGFIAYQNAANIQLHLASSKAGFTASLPDWKPDGYSVSKFSYSPGSVAVNFQNNSDHEAFDLTQTVSNWDSETLLDNFVTASSNTYQTVQSAGRTIYTYGDNNATWVNGGVWYRVTTDGNLSTSQLIKLASSM